MPPIVALLTDFGSADSYAGETRGAVLCACPDANVVDLTHDIPAHDVAEGAWVLGAAYRTFPAGTVFVAVVDPGVGSPRRALAVDAGGYRFVGPDNGILSRVLEAHADAAVHEITNAGLMRHQVSNTFHARDVFAPVAGYLAKDRPLADVGPVADDPVRLPASRAVALSPHEWELRIERIDRFGNLITNLSREQLDEVLSLYSGDPSELVVVAGEAVLPLTHAYADVSAGDACALAGGSGRLELAVNGGRASDVLALGPGDVLRIRPAVSRG